jgi:hypothetical protein
LQLSAARKIEHGNTVTTREVTGVWSWKKRKEIRTVGGGKDAWVFDWRGGGFQVPRGTNLRLQINGSE